MMRRICWLSSWSPVSTCERRKASGPSAEIKVGHSDRRRFDGGDYRSSEGSTGWRIGVRDEVDEGDGFVAVRAGTSGADASAEQVAVRAALGAEVAGLAGRALVDGDRA